MAAEGLITFEELREKLAGLEEGRTVVEEELKALEPNARTWSSWSKIRKRCSRPTRR
jgi:tetrahydromethanopterin S-methyltransferase subunit B